MFTLLVFLAILAVLVISHELGHFIAARKSGMKVYEFGFGFPPRLFGIQKIGDKWRFVGMRNKTEIGDDGPVAGLTERSEAKRSRGIP